MTEWVRYEDTTIEVTRDGRYRRRGREWTPCLNTEGYKQINLNKRTVRLHQIIARVFIPNPDEKPCVDHIDGNRLNNNVENLRWATMQENLRNRSPRSRPSGLPRGVQLNKKKYLAKIRVNEMYECLGTYETPEEASAVYEARAREVYGEFYRPIVPPVRETA